MPSFNDNHIRRLDGTLLLVFEAVMDSGKLTVAAHRLGLTQSAVSHALKRLREIFDDELFIRATHGVRPTERAIALRGALKEVLRLLSGAVKTPSFDPERDSRVFRMAAPDYETSIFAPLLTEAARGFNGPQFVFRPLVRRQAFEGLKSGDVELLIGYTWDKHGDCESEKLYDEDYLVVARRGHPILQSRLTIARYTSAGHVLVSPEGSLRGIVDGVLAKQGRSRRVVVAAPYFLSALATVARSDLIATLPRRLAHCHAAQYGLETRSPPLAIRPFPVSMSWSRRSGADPALTWLRGQVKQIGQRLSSS